MRGSEAVGPGHGAGKDVTETRPQGLLVDIMFLNFNFALGGHRHLEGGVGPGQRETTGPSQSHRAGGLR